MAPKEKPVPNENPALSNVLDDLCMRFLVNLPAVEYESFERLFFAIESAHWFYDDFYREKDSSLPRLPLKAFAAKLFAHTALLRHHGDDVDRLTAQFQSYKQEVPTCGAALINRGMDKVVLVRAWGQNARWGFPKGKLSKDETELDAAVREVMEETGFDMSSMVDDSTYYVDSMSGGRQSRIFVVTGVPEDTVFETRTRKEISDIKWVSIGALPEAPKAAKVQHEVTLMSTGPEREDKVKNIFFSQYGVAPYTKRIRSWIKRRRKQNGGVTDRMPVSAAEAEDSLLRQSGEDPVGARRENGIGDGEENCLLSTEQQLPGDALSVGELEASLLASKPNSQSKRKGCKVKARGSNGVGKETAGWKSRKDVERDEEKRNRTTFGADGGTRMNSSERDTLFRQYVIETDRIAAEKGLSDDFWPVPYITSKDFTEEELQAAEEAQEKKKRTPHEEATPPTTVATAHSHQPSPVNVWQPATVKRTVSRAKEKPFFFDRAAIMECLNH